MKKILALAAVATFLLSGQGHAATLILDGDFTKPSSITNITSPNTFGAWTVTSGNVDLLGNSYWQSPSLTPNAGSVDLDGFNPGSIAQTFSAPAGHYVLDFSLSGNLENGLGTKFLQVSVGGTTQDYSYTITAANTHANMLYVPETLAFTSLGGPITLSFTSLDSDPNSRWGAVVGDVSVAATPLPGALLLFGTGLAGLFLFARRRAVKA